MKVMNLIENITECQCVLISNMRPTTQFRMVGLLELQFGPYAKLDLCVLDQIIYAHLSINNRPALARFGPTQLGPMTFLDRARSSHHELTTEV